MSSWPWMEGVEVAVADPIAPVCPEDERPSVKDLIQEHADKIAKVKAALMDHPLYDSSKHDDLWILRFCLSHKKSKAALEAAKHTLEFRKQHKLDDKDIRDIPANKVKEGKIHEYVSHWKDDAMIFSHPHPQRGVVIFLKLTSMDQHAVAKHTTLEHTEATLIYGTEWTFQWLDYVTRTTGRFTKVIRFLDMDGFAMSGINRECSKRESHVMSMMEDCYPQLLETFFVMNAPTYMDILWMFIRALVPKRVINKFDIIHPKENPNHLKRLHKHISENHLPECYGGSNPLSPLQMCTMYGREEHGIQLDGAFDVQVTPEWMACRDNAKKLSPTSTATSSMTDGSETESIGTQSLLDDLSSIDCSVRQGTGGVQVASGVIGRGSFTFH